MISGGQQRAVLNVKLGTVQKDVEIARLADEI